MKRWIGVDLHKNQFTVCFYESEEKQEVVEYKVSGAGIESFKKRLDKEDEIALEATGNAGWFKRSVESAVKEVKVINPLQFKIISSSVKKTDKNDSIVMARYLSKGLIPEVRVKSKEEAQISSLISTRTKLVQLRTALKNKIHNILNANGIVSKKESLTSVKGLEAVLNSDVGEEYLFEIRIIINQIRVLNESISQIDSKLSDKGKDMPGHKNLTSITGIGDTSAAILLNTIGNIKDFESDKKIAAYFGIIPRVAVSNETAHYGRITKMGNKIARTVLVQSTLVAIRYNPYLRSFYERLKAKKGSGKAIIATAHKLLTIIYRTLKNGWVFEDFNAYKIAAPLKLASAV